MATTGKIGIIYRPSGWTGGVYYILNFIQALKNAKNQKLPRLIIFCDKESDFNFILKETKYPFLVMQLIPAEIKLGKLKKLANKISAKFIGKNIFETRFNKEIDFVFPFSYSPFFELIKRRVYWIPDLQDKFFPEFFDESTVQARDKHYQKIASKTDIVVFSSQAAVNNFTQFYPVYHCRPFILHFASMGQLESLPDKQSLCDKFNLPDKFFFSPNQFWRHKNHKVVVDAVALLKKKGVNVTVAFSGNENDPRSPEYVAELKKLVKKSGVENEIRFLGFIEREEVFGLMKYSCAVIQPSKFEGWSTVVEDALSVNASLILTDLDVNKEQVDKNVVFFHPDDFSTLAGLIEVMNKKREQVQQFNYSLRRQNYTNDIYKLIETVTANG